MDIGKVTIQQVNRFTVTIGGKEYDDFKKVDEWSGMLKFKGPAGIVIVHKEEDMMTTFASVFGNVKQADATKFDVAKISPNLVPIKLKEI